jgi:hypothetical protein
MKKLITIIMLACLVSAAHGAKHVAYLSTSDLTSYSHLSAARGSYYTLEFPVPHEVGGKEIYGAFLELYADVEGVARDTTSVSVPVLEVYALKTAFTGSINPSQFERSTGSVVNVNPGTSERIVLDVTAAVLRAIREPTANHGLILGGLEGDREGTFTVRSNVLGSGRVAKLTIHYDNRVH